jgi:hypothetical protein
MPTHCANRTEEAIFIVIFLKIEALETFTSLTAAGLLVSQLFCLIKI